MMNFYNIMHDTAYQDGMAEVDEIVDGLVDPGHCSVCDRGGGRPAGDLTVVLVDEPARRWPDLMACVHYPCLVASHRFVDAMRASGIRIEPGGEVVIAEPLENGLCLGDAPRYVWVDGHRHLAAKMDFETSGFVGAQFCTNCGLLGYDIGASYDRQHADPPAPYAFEFDEAAGHDLFTTDLSSSFFFCTERVLQCASENRLINLAFTRAEEGIEGKRVKY